MSADLSRPAAPGRSTAGAVNPPGPPVEPEADVKMTIWEHLDELRKRIIRAAIGLLLTTGVCWAFRVKLLAWLLVPYEHAWRARNFPGAPELQTLSPADAFVGYLQLSLVGGVVAAAPLLFYQLWAFISPGLYTKEKRLIFPFVLFSTTLFLSGVAFAYYVALVPLAAGVFYPPFGLLLSPIFAAGAMGLSSVTVVSRNPRQVCSVTAVPMYSRRQNSVTHAENWAESNTSARLCTPAIKSYDQTPSYTVRSAQLGQRPRRRDSGLSRR